MISRSHTYSNSVHLAPDSDGVVPVTKPPKKTVTDFPEISEDEAMETLLEKETYTLRQFTQCVSTLCPNASMKHIEDIFRSCQSGKKVITREAFIQRVMALAMDAKRRTSLNGQSNNRLRKRGRNRFGTMASPNDRRPSFNTALQQIQSHFAEMHAKVLHHAGHTVQELGQELEEERMKVRELETWKESIGLPAQDRAVWLESMLRMESDKYDEIETVLDEEIQLRHATAQRSQLLEMQMSQCESSRVLLADENEELQLELDRYRKKYEKVHAELLSEMKRSQELEVVMKQFEEMSLEYRTTVNRLEDELQKSRNECKQLQGDLSKSEATFQNLCKDQVSQIHKLQSELDIYNMRSPSMANVTSHDANMKNQDEAMGPEHRFPSRKTLIVEEDSNSQWLSDDETLPNVPLKLQDKPSDIFTEFGNLHMYDEKKCKEQFEKQLRQEITHEIRTQMEHNLRQQFQLSMKELQMKYEMNLRHTMQSHQSMVEQLRFRHANALQQLKHKYRKKISKLHKKCEQLQNASHQRNITDLSMDEKEHNSGDSVTEPLIAKKKQKRKKMKKARLSQLLGDVTPETENANCVVFSFKLW